MKNILIAIDKRRHADQLISKAVNLAKLTNGKIWLLHVTPSNPDDFLALEAGPQYLYDQRIKDRKKEAAFIEHCAGEIIQKHGIPAEGLLIEGSIQAIRDKVNEHNMELFIAGNQRKNFLDELLAPTRKRILWMT